jgi:hypothetical protein
VIATWANFESVILAQKIVSSGGAISPAWGSGSPVALSDPTSFGRNPSAAEDGSGGVLVAWALNRYLPATKTEVRVQKVNSAGVPQWTANGVTLVDSSVVGGTSLWQEELVAPTVARDGGGGAYVAWGDFRNDSGSLGNDDIYAQRVNAAGVVQWASGGISLPAPIDLAASQRYPRMVSDLQGGALVTFQDQVGSWDITLVKLNSTGKAWLRGVIWDSRFDDLGDDQTQPAIVYDASGPAPRGCLVAYHWKSWYVAAQKVQIGASAGGNIATEGTGLMGTQNPEGLDTPVFHAGLSTCINDSNPTTQVNTWNGTVTDKLSYVGILWPAPRTEEVLRLELTFAAFGDGGWFGPNGLCPGPGGLLGPSYLTEPDIQITADGGITWSSVPHISDYLNVANGQGIGGGAFPNPTSFTATFMLRPAPPVLNINGIRLIGAEGGLASGGFLGVFELAIYPKVDTDADGMDDAWEAKNGLIVGINDAAADPDADSLNNIGEFNNLSNPMKADSDGDGLGDGAEVNTHHTRPDLGDTDGDDVGDGWEVNVSATNPLSPDSDGDKFSDGKELACGSNPNLSSSIPCNLSTRIDASAFLGTASFIGGPETKLYYADTAETIHDTDRTTWLNSYNGAGAPETVSFVGVSWKSRMSSPVAAIVLTLATFHNGGWFGPNNVGPGAGGFLSASAHLIAPTLQVSADGGKTWSTPQATSDYLQVLDNHPLPQLAFEPPTRATSLFTLTRPESGINAIRLIGLEGGTSSGGYLGVFEFAVLTRIPETVVLRNPRISEGTFRFDFDVEPGVIHTVEFRSDLRSPWLIYGTYHGDSPQQVTFSDRGLGSGPRFYRVINQ